MTEDQQAQAATKSATLATVEAELADGGGTSASPMALPAPGGSSSKVVLAEIANMIATATNGKQGPGPRYKEGQGDGLKSYTCGPAATRNMIAAMFKNRDGSYKNIAEATIGGWENTTTSGTARANVAAALNAHESAFGHWSTSRPANDSDYLADVVTDVSYHQAVIANIDTEFLGFWNNKALDHFDLVYGYDLTGSGPKVAVAEEWDPIYIYGSSSYGNPYGLHWVNLANAYQAVINTSIHGVVA